MSRCSMTRLSTTQEGDNVNLAEKKALLYMMYRERYKAYEARNRMCEDKDRFSWNQLSMSMCDAYVSAIAKTGQYDERT